MVPRLSTVQAHGSTGVVFEAPTAHRCKELFWNSRVAFFGERNHVGRIRIEIYGRCSLGIHGFVERILGLHVGEERPDYLVDVGRGAKIKI